MSENLAMEVEDDANEVKEAKPKPHRKVCRGVNLSSRNRRINGIIRCKTVPSYTLRRAFGGSRPELGTIRSENRTKMRYLLRRLVRRHNWDEASGVLSVLLKGTCKDKSPSKNRTKYWATMELLKKIKGDSINPRKIQRVYELWMKKIGTMRSWPMKDRFVVQLEFILLCLKLGNTEDAHQAVICLLQEREFGSDPISNLVVGLTFYQLWYTSIPKELQLRDLGESYTPMQSGMSEHGFSMSIVNSEGEVQEANSAFRHDSNTSVRNDKDIGMEVDVAQHREASMEVDDNLQRDTPCQNFQAQGFYMNLSQSSGQEEFSFSHHYGNVLYASIFNARDLESWLLPLRLPHSNEDLEDFIHCHRKMCNDYYKDAVKYLRLALYGTPPASEALFPLIQMLLLGDQVKEALDELDKFVSNSNTALPLRLKASLLGNFDKNNYTKLSTCFEDILKKDPTCRHSLARLVGMHRNGDYSAEKLLEMIALHLDATYAECDTWKDFALCFLKLSQCEEDRISICHDGSEGGLEQKSCYHFNRIPGIFSSDMVERTWRFRCRWWLTRHFSQNILASELAGGDLQLITYKAASGSHLYGQELEYVVKASACLEKEENRDMFSFLQMHMRNSIGFYLNFDNKNR